MITSGVQPSSIIQPDSVFCAIGGFHLRSSTVPHAQRIAAARMSSAPVGVERMWRMSSPSSTTMPSMPSASPTILRLLSGSCSTNIAMSVAQIGIVYAMIALRPAGSCCTPNSTKPFQPAMLKNARTATRSHHSRGMRIASRLARATSSMPMRGERQRDRAERERRELADAELEHGPVAAPDEREDRDRNERVRERVRAGGGDGHQRSRPGSVSPNFDRCSSRACVDPAVAADAAGKLGQTRVELVDVALAPARDLAVRRHAELVQHPLEDRTDAHDELEIVGRVRSVEQRRHRVVLEVHDDLAVAGGLAARLRDLAQQAPAILRHRGQLRAFRVGGGDRAPQRGVLGFKAAHEPRALRGGAVFRRCRAARRRRRGCGRWRGGRRPGRRGRSGGFESLRRFGRDDGGTQRGPVHDRRLAAAAHDAGAIRDEQAHRQREHHEQRQAIHGG